ncbi:MAG: hypothetical protein ACLSHC_06845 [Bilophila wadsworthia]
MKPLLAKAARKAAPCSTAWSPPICSPTAVPSHDGFDIRTAIYIVPPASSSPSAPTASTATLPA